MKVAFLSPSLSRNAGGIFEIERCLALALAKINNTSIEVFGLSDAHTAVDAPLWHPLKMHTFNACGSRTFGFSLQLRQAFLSCVADIAHLHAMWTYPSILIREWSHRHQRPYMTTLNGMLEPWALGNSMVKKKIAAFLYESRSLNGACCIQVNSEAELISARSFGLKNPIAIIPNGVDLPALDRPLDLSAGELGALKNQGYKILLYLGRLHQKKGLANLIQAVHRMADKDWILAIVGWDQFEHESELLALSDSLLLRDRVLFLGPRFGFEKELVLRQADAFILPSYSEGMPMAVLEAWAAAKPVVMTRECNLPIGFTSGAAIPMEPTVTGVREGLDQLFAMSDADRVAMGQRGRRLATDNYSWSSVADRIRSVYTWMLGGGTAPSWVVLD